MSNTPESDSLNINDINPPTSDYHTQKQQSKAAQAANQLFDHANGSHVISPGQTVRINQSDIKPSERPKISQFHEFGPLEAPISRPESDFRTDQVNGHTSQSSPQSFTHKATSTAQRLENETRISRIIRLLHFKRIFSRRNLIYLSIGVVSCVVFYLVFNFQNILLQINYAFSRPKPEPAIAIPAETKLINQEPAVAPPGNVIIIPKINVNAPIVFEPNNSEQAVQLALRNGVVHYGGTGVFGKPGNAVIVGHSSLDPWSPGNYKYVFALLEKMVAGDQIQINYEQKKYVYQIVETKVVAPTDLSVLAQTDEHRITLITCTPVGTNWRRFIIHANQVEPLPGAKIAVANEEQPAQQPADLPGKAPFFLDKVKNFFQNIF